MCSYFVILFAIFALTHSIHGGDENDWSRGRTSDRLSSLGDLARDLSEQLSSQAQQTASLLAPHAAQAVSGLTSLGRQVGQQVREGLQKRVSTGGERETEGGEVEVFNEKPRPSILIRPIHPFFNLGLLTPWWQGPNVCEEKSEIEEPVAESSNSTGFFFNFESTSCSPSPTTYVCTRKIHSNGEKKTVVLKRRCCHGFVRREDGRPGCSALKMVDVWETVKSLEMGKFAEWVESAGMRGRLQAENLTVFVPPDEAIADYEDDSDDNEIYTINAQKMRDKSGILARHIAEGFQNVHALENEHLLQTLDAGAKIRINKYRTDTEVVTANCVPLTGKNHFATNGIVHLISGVLPQPELSVGELIEQEEGFLSFRKLLKENGLMDDLKNPDKSWTLFIPTDTAFENVPHPLKKVLDVSHGCSDALVHAHVVKGTVCSGAVSSKSGVRNLLNNVLLLTRDDEQNVRVNGAQVTLQNRLGTNGVIHVIDQLIIPPKARSILKALEDEERKDLLDLIERAGMTRELEEAQNFTFFVPSKDALKRLPNETLSKMEKDTSFLKKILRHHLVHSNTPISSFSHQMKLKTHNGHDLYHKLHETFPGLVTAATIQCAYVVDFDQEACGAVIHKINKVIMPPEGTILETIKNMKGHDIVMKLLQSTDLGKRLDEEGPFTFLAPTDEAFERMGDIQLEHLLENSTMAEDVLKMHILPEVLCCNGISPASAFHRQFARTLAGNALPVHRGLSMDRVRFGRARATTCDLPATNGLVHSVNKVILPEAPTPLRVNLWSLF